MDLTIIIVNWNGGELLNHCLRSIRASKTPFAVHVIVVDNASKDGSRESAQREFPEFNIFNSGSNLGFGKANNLARTLVKTPLVLFLNPDTELREDTLARCVQALEQNPDVGALSCKMVYPSGEVQQQGLQWFPSPSTILVETLFLTKGCRRLLRPWLPLMNPHQSGPVRKLYGGYFMARREVLDKANWFDERYFMYAEDSDLSRTISDLGWKLYYVADAEIVHTSGGSSVEAPSGFATLMRQESMNLMIRKYQGPLGALMHRIALMAGSAVRLLAALVLCVVTWPIAGNRFQRHRSNAVMNQLIILWSLGLRKPIPAS